MVYQCGLSLRRKVGVWWSKSREEPWRAQAASPRQSRSNPNLFGEIGSTQFSEQGFAPCSFFAGLKERLSAFPPADSRANRRAARNPTCNWNRRLSCTVLGLTPQYTVTA